MSKYRTRSGEVTIAALDDNDDAQLAKINPQTNIIATMGCCESAVLKGVHYFCSASTSLNTSGVKDYLVDTPNTTTWAHGYFALTGSAITQFDIYEDTGWGESTDTAITAFNNNRNSTDSATVLVYEAPSTDATVGTLIHTYKGGSATQQSRDAAATKIERALVLKQNSKYLIRFTSASDNNLINFGFEWAEFAHN